MLVKRISFCHVYYIDPDLGTFASISYTEVEPLEIACCICIWPQKHIIAVSARALDNQVQVSALEVRVEVEEFELLVLGNTVIDLLAFRVHTPKVVGVFYISAHHA